MGVSSQWRSPKSQWRYTCNGRRHQWVRWRRAYQRTEFGIFRTLRAEAFGSDRQSESEEVCSCWLETPYLQQQGVIIGLGLVNILALVNKLCGTRTGLLGIKRHPELARELAFSCWQKEISLVGGVRGVARLHVRTTIGGTHRFIARGPIRGDGVW